MTWFEKYTKNRTPNLKLFSKNGGVYLNRWNLIPKNRFFKIYLHKFTDSDEETFHDHPWHSLSFVLSGILMEVFLNAKQEQTLRIVRKGAWVYRSAKRLHYILLPSSNPVWTIFITGPKIREWGFLKPQGWIHHLEYESIRKGERNG